MLKFIRIIFIGCFVLFSTGCNLILCNNLPSDLNEPGPGASRRASPIGRLGGEPILNSAWAFRNGVSEVEALRMATLNAAEMLDVADRMGSIAVGKDADFVVLEGHPFDYRVVPSYVFVDGRLEVERR